MKPTPKSLWLSISTALSVAYLAYAESPQSTGVAQPYTQTQSGTPNRSPSFEIRQAGDNTSYMQGARTLRVSQAIGSMRNATIPARMSTASASTVPANAVQANIVPTNIVPTNIVRANTVQANMGQANTVRADTVQANIAQPNIAQANFVQASSVQTNTLQASTAFADTALRKSPPSRQHDRMRAPSRAKNSVRFRTIAASQVNIIAKMTAEGAQETRSQPGERTVHAVAYSALVVRDSVVAVMPKLVSRRGGLVLQPDAVEAFETVQRDPESQSIRQKLGDFTVTAYALTANSTGKSPGQPGFGITASGSRASVGRTVAVDPSVIPIGSLVYIDLPGIGWRLAEDTGGAIKGRHIDLLLPSDGAAIQFGIKHSVPVYTMLR